MTCEFLENFSLRRLIAPVTKEDFKARYWEQKPLVIHRGAPDFYHDLFTMHDFDAAITRSPDYVKMANAASKKNLSYKTESAPGLESVLADMRDGGTIVLDQLHHKEPNLGLLCRLLAAELGHKFQMNLYLTPPNGKGFSPHWDNHDVFILQLLGSKHWNIEKDRRVLLPSPLERMADEGRELRGETLSFTLEQGDLIYIPRGFVHAAECGSAPSLHITLGVTGIFVDDFLRMVIKAAAQRDASLREALPFGFMEGEQPKLVDRAVEVLRQVADKRFISAVFDQYRDEMVRNYQLDISGQVEDFFQPSPLAPGDLVGPRRGVVYRMNPGDDSVRVNIGARTVTFPGFFRDALEFALSIPVFAIRDLPGDLEDEERIAFIERLIQEGLIIRKTGASDRQDDQNSTGA